MTSFASLSSISLPMKMIPGTEPYGRPLQEPQPARATLSIKPVVDVNLCQVSRCLAFKGARAHSALGAPGIRYATCTAPTPGARDAPLFPHPPVAYLATSLEITRAPRRHQ